jgi:hypothetical protein
MTSGEKRVKRINGLGTLLFAILLLSLSPAAGDLTLDGAFARLPLQSRVELLPDPVGSLNTEQALASAMQLGSLLE